MPEINRPERLGGVSAVAPSVGLNNGTQTAIAGEQMVLESEGSSALDFPLIHSGGRKTSRKIT
jgi:hypothetical protein